MPYDPETGEPIEPEGEPQGDDNRNIRLLREQAKRGEQADQAMAERDEARRELAVIKSGIDLSTKAGQLFLKAFDGDPTDAEALKTAAEEYEVPFIGAANTPEGEGEGETGEGEGGDGAGEGSNGTEQRSALANGAPADTGVSPHPTQVALDAANAVIDGGGSEEAGFETYMRSKASAAVNGDKRVLYDPAARAAAAEL